MFVTLSIPSNNTFLISAPNSGLNTLSPLSVSNKFIKSQTVNWVSVTPTLNSTHQTISTSQVWYTIQNGSVVLSYSITFTTTVNPLLIVMTPPIAINTEIEGTPNNLGSAAVLEGSTNMFVVKTDLGSNINIKSVGNIASGTYTVTGQVIYPI